ncbi:hypothetical protein K2X89_18275, partial [Myxococcota bacterium]|nr:hypothetical protein [Myxococcota bacterium]
ERSGRIRHRTSHAIRSGDYYSFENYGSRLVDHRLVIYAPIDLSNLDEGKRSPWPAYSTWGRSGLSASWQPLVDEIEIVEPLQAGFEPTLYAVIECDLETEFLDCRARGVLGSGYSVHHVSATALHLWLDGPIAPFDPMSMSPEEYEDRLRAEPDALGAPGSSSGRDAAMVYRIPFDGSPIGAVEVEGSPFDQFSFREADGALDLFLVRRAGGWREPTTPSWWHVPIASFERGAGGSAGIEVNPLPGLEGGWVCQGAQRFVADHLIYGDCRGRPQDRRGFGVHVVDLASEQTPRFLETPGRVDRIEPMGGDALVVGKRIRRTGSAWGRISCRSSSRIRCKQGPPSSSKGGSRSRIGAMHSTGRPTKTAS